MPDNEKPFNPDLDKRIWTVTVKGDNIQDYFEASLRSYDGGESKIQLSRYYFQVIGEKKERVYKKIGRMTPNEWRNLNTHIEKHLAEHVEDTGTPPTSKSADPIQKPTKLDDIPEADQEDKQRKVHGDEIPF